MTGDVLTPERPAKLTEPPAPEVHASRGPDPVAEMPPPLAVIRSKVQALVLREPVLERPRLLGWLDQHAMDRVILISAEVGYGKSTLLADFARRSDTRSLWYRLESTDRDWMSFISHLVASVRESQPAFGAATEALLRHVAAVGPTRDMVLSSLLAELGDLSPTRTFVLFDDFHFVDGSDDVRAIMRRLIESAPQDWHFFIAARGRPSLPLGRLAASGQLGELTTKDLRFTRAELDDLFVSAHAQQLSKESLDIVEARTEGWAASLQLVAASIAASRPSQVEAFIGALSGADGPIYDFLAEEVLERLSPATQHVLSYASLLDHITPQLVEAALSVAGQPVGVDDVAASLREAESLGLFSARLQAPTSVRFHPLLREFLEHQLRRHLDGERLASTHAAIAQVAEETDWLAAAKHYAVAGRSDDSMRVLGAAAHQALGTGAWGAAAEIIGLMPNVPPPPAVQVIRARALIADGRATEALAILDGLEWNDTEQAAYALMLLTRATALHTQGHASQVEATVDAVARASSTPRLLRDVASAWYLMLRSNGGDSIADACAALHRLSDDMSGIGLHYYAGVALHNTASAELAQANYGRALSLSIDAQGQFTMTPRHVDILTSTLMIEAAARAEQGDVQAGMEIAKRVVRDTSPTADAIAEASYMAAVTGNVHLAEKLLERFRAGGVSGFHELGAKSQAYFARVSIALAYSAHDEAARLLESIALLGPTEVDGPSRTAAVRALLATLAGWPSRSELVSRAIEVADAQGAARWAIRAKILNAGLHRDADGFRHSVERAIAESHLAYLEFADAIVMFLDLLDPLPDSMLLSIGRARQRWLPILRRETAKRNSPAAPHAARALSRIGSIEDAVLLRAYERDRGRSRRRTSLVTNLVRRLSPTVRVHDLGPTTYEIGDRSVHVTDTRRRAASLLLFLVTRPRQSAARDLVMEQLWPDQSPRSALNSLHQTLFFLRRDLELWYEDGLTGDYVRMEGELIYLDPEMFQIDSVAFHRQASTILSARSPHSFGPDILRLYTGTFAPEFEYEPWAEEWRNQLHTTFLRLAQVTSEYLTMHGAHAEAANVLARVVEVDPLAFNLRCRLVRALQESGAGDAAQVHYRGLASAYERELGLPLVSYSQVLEGLVKLETDD